MSLVFAALTPHSPLLLKHVPTENDSLPDTRTAFAYLQDELLASHVDTLIVLSAHAGEHDEVFTVFGNDLLHPSFTQFGDINTHPSFSNDLQFVSQLKEASKTQHTPLTLNCESTLDYASAVPLMLLRDGLRKNTVATIGGSAQSPKDHFDFGYLLKDIVLNSAKRYGVIVSTDLAHTLVTESPSGYSPAGQQFDDEVREKLANYNTTALLQFDETIAENAVQCALEPLLIFLGMIQRTPYTYKELAYETPGGVGCLTAQFILR